ncbi:MAG: hypothetical protein IKC51_05180 [Myxococcaceae bacterium]|nr:hypothetical protein [Myxococcaceae bacterium]
MVWLLVVLEWVESHRPIPWNGEKNGALHGTSSRNNNPQSLFFLRFSAHLCFFLCLKRTAIQKPLQRGAAQKRLSARQVYFVFV